MGVYSNKPIGYERNGMLLVKESGYEDNWFEIVEHVPLGYTIWNIGKHMPPGYLPFCRIKPIQPFLGGKEIEIDTLKVMRLGCAQTVLKATGWCGSQIRKNMELYVKKNKNSSISHYRQKANDIEKGLEILRTLDRR